MTEERWQAALLRLERKVDGIRAELGLDGADPEPLRERRVPKLKAYLTRNLVVITVAAAAGKGGGGLTCASRRCCGRQ